MFASWRTDFGAKISGPRKAHNKVHKSVCITVACVTHLDSEAQLIWHRENGWKEVCLDPQAAWLVQGRIGRAARNIASKSPPVHMGRTAATCCFGNRRAMDTRIAWGVRRAERTGGRDNANTKRQAGNSLRQEKDVKFFVENVTI
jgi:hypothetical protein